MRNWEYASAITSFTLKDKGFTESTVGYYMVPKDENAEVQHIKEHINSNNSFKDNKYGCSCPTLSQVLNWLTFQRKCYIEVILFDSDQPDKGWTYKITRVLESITQTIVHDKKYTDYFEALSNAVDQCVSLI